MVKVIRQGVYFMEEKLVKEGQAFMTSEKKRAAQKNVLSHALLHEGERRDLYAAYGVAAPDVLLFSRCEDAVFSLESDVENAAVRADSAWDAADCLCERAAGETLLARGMFPSCGPLGILSARCEEPFGAEKWEDRPVAALYLRGKLRRGVGQTDAILSLRRALQKRKYAAGTILEVFGSGLSSLSMDARFALDAALQELGFATVWATDERACGYAAATGREIAVKSPRAPAFYESGILLDLTRTEPMIDCGGIFTVREYLEGGGNALFTGGTAAGRDASYETVSEIAEIVRGSALGAFRLGIAPRLSAWRGLARSGALAALVEAGAELGDFLEGCILTDGGEGAAVDARTLAATAKNGGKLVSALSVSYNARVRKYLPDGALWKGREIAKSGKGENA